MSKGLIFNIQRYAINDGPGIRTTVFLKGCPARCWWCHNPEAVKETPNDRLITVDDLLTEIKKDVIFYDTSGGGVTFSGGEPLAQPEFLEEILSKCKDDYINTALDTTGCAPKEVFERIIDKVDLFLYDLKLMDEKLHKKYTGISNELIHSNLQALVEKEKLAWIRFPIIPGITDLEENVAGLRDYVRSLETIKEISLLPYHRIAEAKYTRLGLENKMLGVEPPSQERMEKLKKYFEEYGFNVRIGG
ncbi:MAG TPA: glycyl-radical enzyme activating protein [Candidatus Nanoarchaeia archaeon]|nr:glycyl-radical enzyme activating protein [Candidatus Nanoarchaeia archaeon]